MDNHSFNENTESNENAFFISLYGGYEEWGLSDIDYLLAEMLKWSRDNEFSTARATAAISIAIGELSLPANEAIFEMLHQIWLMMDTSWQSNKLDGETGKAVLKILRAIKGINDPYILEKIKRFPWFEKYDVEEEDEIPFY